MLRGFLIVVTAAWGASLDAQQLEVELVGNAGVMLSDGTTALLVDLPYQPGAFGYMRYDPADLEPKGSPISVITHHHRDHFDAELFLARAGWRIIGPPSVVTDLPDERVLAGDRLTVGDFTVEAIHTPHTDDHRSYRIGWRGRVLHFVGDTEDPSHLATEGHLDLLFITPWLSCAMTRRGQGIAAGQAIAYHLRPNGTDRICGAVDALPQGTRLTLDPSASPGAGSP